MLCLTNSAHACNRDACYTTCLTALGIFAFEEIVKSSVRDCKYDIQTLALYSLLIEALYYSPEIWRQTNSYDRAGGNSRNGFQRYQQDN